MSKHGTAALLALLLAVATAPGARADDRGAFSLLVENDLFFNTDRHYTNGIEFAYTTPPLDKDHWAVAAANWLPFFQSGDKVRVTYALGQDMVTPSDTTRANPDPTDRPYAGYLFAALGVLSQSKDHMDQLQFQIGMIGPASLAEDAQKFVHSIIHVPKPKGWSFQLRDEPGIELTYEQTLKFMEQRHLLGLDFDVQPHYGAAIGNVYDYVNAGLMLRGGFKLPEDFGPMRLDPSLPGSNFFEPKDWISAYVFAGVDARAVGHNIFLDGNTFVASRSVDKNILVGDFLVGAAIAFDSFRIAFTHVVRTREFKSQTSTDQFGAISLTARF